MEDAVKPIYLFADSRPLFLKQGGKPFLASVWDFLSAESPKAAYIGASNGDDPNYFSIFQAAMDNIRVRDCRMIMSAFPADDRQFLEQADIILLAGGSASRGWQVFEQSGMKEVIAERYQGGAILMGTSAGAMQLGVLGWEEEDLSAETFFYTFGLVPFIISAHEEKESWERLKKAVVFLGNYIPGLGIPSGGGMLYHPNSAVEPIPYPIDEFSVKDGKLQHNLLLAGEMKEI